MIETCTTRVALPRPVRFAALTALWLAAVPAASAQQAFLWLQTDAQTSTRGTASNPALTADAGNTRSLYLWSTRDALSYGFDGVSIDVRMISSDAGSADAMLTFDRPPGRWSAATGGGQRSDSGGTGVDDANAIDLTNTDTLPVGDVRLAKLDVTGTASGTVSVYVCVGGLRITDGGSNVLLNLGFGTGSLNPESLPVSGGSFNACSNVAEAVLTITRPVPGDTDGDGDVDQSDFGLLQACFSGDLVPQPDPACDIVKLDGDNDVDGADFLIYAACVSGSGMPGNPDCAG